MKRTWYEGKEYVISRVRDGQTELVSVSDGTFRKVPGVITPTHETKRDLITGLIRFLDRPRTFLDELRRKRITASTKPGPSKARKKSEDGEDSAEGTVNRTRRTKSPGGSGKRGKSAGPKYPSPEEIVRLKLMPKQMRDTIMSTLGYSELPGMFD